MLEFMNWSLALVPVLTMLEMFVWLDVFKLMTLWEMLGVLLLGAATCCGVFSTGRAAPARAASMSSGPTPWSTLSEAPSGSGESASASAHVEIKKSRQPASASRLVTSIAPSP